jgi:dethiobiotin synthetase
MADLVVTGTDTDVGKTVVAAAIILGLRHMGIRAVGFKPVESGLAPERRRTPTSC